MGKRCKCNIISLGYINIYLLLIPFGALFDTAISIIIDNSKKLGPNAEQQHPII